MQLSRLHKYQNQWRWHMLVPFEVGLHLVTASPMYASTTRSGFLFLFFSWGHTLLTGVTVGNMSAFTDKLDWWIDPWFNSAGCQEQQISIHLVKKKTPLNSRCGCEQSRWIHILYTCSIHHQVDSLFSWQWMWAWKMSLQLYCIHTTEAIIAGCKGTTKYP